MSWDFYENKKIKARKEYDCQLCEYLSMADIIIYDRINKTWSICPTAKEDFELSDDDLKAIQDYINSGFKIVVGEIHNHTTGKYDGEFVSFRSNIAISNICHKLDLFEE